MPPAFNSCSKACWVILAQLERKASLSVSGSARPGLEAALQRGQYRHSLSGRLTFIVVHTEVWRIMSSG